MIYMNSKENLWYTFGTLSKNKTSKTFYYKGFRGFYLSRGTAVYSVKGTFLYSLWLCQICPPLHGERSSQQAESPLFSRVEDKKNPA